MMSRSRMGAFGAALVLAAFAPDVAADANSLNDNLGPREISVGEAMRADSRGAQAITLNPAGLGLDTALVLEGSFGHRPGDGALIASASACDSTVPVPGCFYYKWISAEPAIGGTSMKRRAHELGMVLSRRLSSRLTIGVTGKYFDYNSELTGEEDANGFSWDAGLVLRATPVVNLAMVGYNLFGDGDGSRQYPRAVATGIAARFSPKLVAGVDALWNLQTAEGEGTGRYGGGVEYQVFATQSAYPIRIGGVYDAQLEAGYITGGIGLLTPKLGVDIGARKQLSGGDELMVSASLRIFGPRQPHQAQPRSGRRFARR